MREQSYTAERRCSRARVRHRDTREQKDALRSRIVTLPTWVELRLVALRQLDPSANSILTLTLRARSILLLLLLLVGIAKLTCEVEAVLDIRSGVRVEYRWVTRHVPTHHTHEVRPLLVELIFPVQ